MGCGGSDYGEDGASHLSRCRGLRLVHTVGIDDFAGQSGQSDPLGDKVTVPWDCDFVAIGTSSEWHQCRLFSVPGMPAEPRSGRPGDANAEKAGREVTSFLLSVERPMVHPIKADTTIRVGSDFPHDVLNGEARLELEFYQGDAGLWTPRRATQHVHWKKTCANGAGFTEIGRLPAFGRREIAVHVTVSAKARVRVRMVCVNPRGQLPAVPGVSQDAITQVWPAPDLATDLPAEQTVATGGEFLLQGPMGWLIFDGRRDPGDGGGTTDVRIELEARD